VTTFAAIPTMYRGVRFRSRLEARWAAFFDVAGWSWVYEPVELPGYIPDFLVVGPGGARAAEILVEVKPAACPEETQPACSKVVASGWGGHACVVGRDPSIGSTRVAPGPAWLSVPFFAWLLPDSWQRRWAEAGNLTQYKPGSP
jgi:hypothetical protein